MKYYLFCFALLIGYNSVAKSHEQIILDTSSLEQLTRYHQQGRISDEKYLDSVYTLSNKLFISGQTFETGDLKLHLNNFYKLSFEKKGLEKYQIKYYLILSVMPNLMEKKVKASSLLTK